ncbi:MAG: hypothetical protein ACKOD2_14830 [Ilumatobacteraceae bacterium]
MNESQGIERRSKRSCRWLKGAAAVAAVVPLLVTSGVVLGGCGDDAGSVTGRVDDVSRSATSRSTSVETTIPTGTTSDSHQVDVTTLKSPAPSTTTVVDLDDSVDRLLLETEFRSLLDRRLECVRSPRQCDPSDFAVENSSLHADVSRLLAGRLANGIVATDGGYDVRSLTVVRVSDHEVEVTTCLVDSVVLADVSGDAPVLVDDSVRGERAVWTMRVTPNGWRLGSKEVERWSMDDSVCAG